jgi:hypothetical protein
MIGRLFARKKAATAEAPAIVVKGTRQRSAGDARLRIGMTMAVFFGIYAAIGGRLAYLGMQEVEAGGPPQTRVTASRPDIVDRNGEVLATDINTASLFAEPRRIVDVDEAVEKLLTVLPDLDVEMAYRRLSTQAGFVWLRRQLSPRQQQAIMDLGVPGLGFRTEKRRFYPGGPTASHVLGLVNVDNNGIAGMEKWIDDQGLADLRALGLVDESSLQPVRLSLDLRVQHIVRDELVQAMERYDAIGAAATVVNARTGEVMAMVSLPDYDPNNPFNAHEKDRLNRITGGVYEMGSTFKIFATAMALDSGLFNLNSRFDASQPLRIAGGLGARLSRPRPGAHLPGGLHLFLQHRHGAHGGRGRGRGPSRVPRSSRPLEPHDDGAAGSGPPDRTVHLAQDQLDHRFLRLRRLDDADADGHGVGGTAQWWQAHQSDLPAALGRAGDGRRHAGGGPVDRRRHALHVPPDRRGRHGNAPTFPAISSAARPARRRRSRTAAMSAASASTASWRRSPPTTRNLSFWSCSRRAEAGAARCGRNGRPQYGPGWRQYHPPLGGPAWREARFRPRQ